MKILLALKIYYSKKKERLCVMMCQHFFDQIVLFNPFQFDEKSLESILRAKMKLIFQILTGFFKNLYTNNLKPKPKI
jgi:hypothetical protein